MRVATWNVNSVRARLPNVLEWLRTAEPDVVLLQETKTVESDFPRLEFQALGYEAAVVGQKSYNGVALLSKRPMSDIVLRLPEEPEDEQARFVEATIGGYRIASLYLPNGNPVDSEKYPYKLRWLGRLRQHARNLLATEMPFVLGGDYNVIPAAEDVYDPRGWENDALYKPETRYAYRALLNEGLTEAWRALHDAEQAYTFWDYQAGRWQRDEGLRIDHFLLSPQAADRMRSCEIDKTPRGRDKASDHTPVVLELED